MLANQSDIKLGVLFQSLLNWDITDSYSLIFVASLRNSKKKSTSDLIDTVLNSQIHNFKLLQHTHYLRTETMLSIEIPDNYSYVFLTCGVLPAVANLLLGGKVMGARKTYNVQYPNLYATPGYHKNADEFNRVQRGHQHIFETLGDFRALSFIGGLAHPLVCAGCGVVYTLGNVLYMAGYSDNKLDVKNARMKKGGPISVLAFLASLVCATKFSISLIK